VQTGHGGRVQQAAPTRAAETLTWARHLIGYLIAGVPAAVITTLLPADEIPDVPGGAAGPMMFPPAAIGGAPLSVGQGQEAPLTHAILASGLAARPALTFLLGSVGLRPPPYAADQPPRCRLGSVVDGTCRPLGRALISQASVVCWSPSNWPRVRLCRRFAGAPPRCRDPGCAIVLACRGKAAAARDAVTPQTMIL
jgi:hypothetical protein